LAVVEDFIADANKKYGQASSESNMVACAYLSESISLMTCILLSLKRIVFDDKKRLFQENSDADFDAPNYVPIKLASLFAMTAQKIGGKLVVGPIQQMFSFIRTMDMSQLSFLESRADEPQFVNKFVGLASVPDVRLKIDNWNLVAEPLSTVKVEEVREVSFEQYKEKKNKKQNNDLIQNKIILPLKSIEAEKRMEKMLPLVPSAEIVTYVKDNNRLHEMLQRELRCIYEADELLKYICYRNGRKRLDMAFCIGSDEVEADRATHFVFRLNTEKIRGFDYGGAIQVCYSTSVRLTELETLVLMLFRIKSELQFDGNDIIQKAVPDNMAFAQMAALNMMRRAVCLERKTSVPMSSIRSPQEQPWICRLFLDTVEGITDFIAKGREYRVLLVDISGNAKKLVLTTSTLSRPQKEIKSCEFTKQITHVWFYFMNSVVEDRRFSVSYSSGLELSVKRWHKYRLVIDVRED